MKTIIEKANVLIESLPYIRKFSGKTFVIKYGGAAMVDENLKDAFAQDIVLLNFIGIKPVIVHGGGPKINRIMEKMGKKPTFVHGQRVTDEETIDIVEMVLGGLINKQIVSLINSHGGLAIGLSGKDGNLIKAGRKVIKKISPETGVPEIIDLGLVGEVEKINPRILTAIEESGFIPVIAPISAGQKSKTLNINADYVAGSIASALKAEKLILLTDVEGIKDKKNELIPALNIKKIKSLMSNNTISGGMLPKVQACRNAIEKDVKKTHIIDGRVPHALLLEIFTEEGIGTEIVK
ncbi:MAG TPA: acetylglutamate kinase [Nitrospirae bacterium]|nr:acetylglutamate kinase [bacterium BMS3Abin06]HDH11794.1 acetylglutamate kinase [Nitrospirota bacterium]HDZ02864.1 acetylglutamate kinase [Nitrospirota bacterium]